MNRMRLAVRYLAASLTALVLVVGGTTALASPANASGSGPIKVTFNDWRCSATGGGSVVAVQMGSQYGSVPYTRGRTITITARFRTANNLTGTVWCKRPWWRGGFTTPVYNIHQGIWPTRSWEHFNA